MALAEAEIVDQADAALADEAGPPRNSGKPRRQSGLPGPGHDQHLAVVFRPQSVGEPMTLLHG